MSETETHASGGGTQPQTVKDDVKAEALTFPTADVAARVGQAVMYGLAEYQRELSSFLAQRFEQDAAFYRRLADCTDPGAMLSTYSGFAQDLVKDYAEEAQKIGSITTKVMAESVMNGETAAPII